MNTRASYKIVRHSYHEQRAETLQRVRSTSFLLSVAAWDTNPVHYDQAKILNAGAQSIAVQTWVSGFVINTEYVSETVLIHFFFNLLNKGHDEECDQTEWKYEFMFEWKKKHQRKDGQGKWMDPVRKERRETTNSRINSVIRKKKKGHVAIIGSQ